MGLAARRAMEDFKTKNFPDYKKQIEEAAGFPLELEIQWETLESDKYTEAYNNSFSKVYFLPLIEAFKKIAADQMGKDALKAGLKKVVVNGSAGFSPSGWTMKAGVLTLLHEPFTNIEQVKQRTEAVIKLLESNL